MLTVEDCLEHLYENFIKYDNYDFWQDEPEWCTGFITSVSHNIKKGLPLTENQGELSVRIIQRYIKILINAGLNSSKILNLISNPTYSLPLKIVLNYPREVRWIGESQLAFRFKFNYNIKENIKLLKFNHPFYGSFPIFDPHSKIWVAWVNFKNVERIIELISTNNFNFDNDTAEFLTEVYNSKSKIDFVNIVDNKIRVTTWSDPIINSILRYITEEFNSNV